MTDKQYVILIHGLAGGGDSDYDEMYLTRFDFEECALGEANMLAAQKPAQALRFPDMLAAWEFWKQIDPRQLDSPGRQA